MQSIPLFDDINDLHARTGSPLRTRNPEFHCFDMGSTNQMTVREMPPHRAGFYTLALNFGTQDLQFTLNQTEFQNPQHFVLCVAPGQVARWEKRGDWYGYCIFFKSSFLQFAGQLNFLQQYPFFNIQESNLLPLAGEAEYCQLAVHFQQILAEQEQKAPFSDEIIRANFQVVLWLVRRLYENTRATTAAQRAGAVLAAQFQYLVNEHFLTQTTVEEYAHLLNVTPNHLSQTIRDFTGRTAKSLISERRLHEARYLLAYTPNDVAEIAYHLGFVEPTHFSKFFKKETGNTPLAYRKSAGR